MQTWAILHNASISKSDALAHKNAMLLLYRQRNSVSALVLRSFHLAQSVIQKTVPNEVLRYASTPNVSTVRALSMCLKNPISLKA